jgi:predicted nucleic acid-binding protein
MDRVRLGQTEQGSFIVALLAPVPPALESVVQNELWPSLSTEPFERIVTRRLADGLIAAHAAAEQAVRRDGLNSFKQVVARGVSANLCDALAGLIDFGEGLEISITWARTRPAPEARRTVEFSRTEAEVYREAARLFRFEEPRSDERLQGYIVSADRNVTKEQGVVTLNTFLDGQPTSIKTQLPPDMYSTALEFHDAKSAISITGDLVRKGQRWWLENPRDILQMADDADSE